MFHVKWKGIEILIDSAEALLVLVDELAKRDGTPGAPPRAARAVAKTSRPAAAAPAPSPRRTKAAPATTPTADEPVRAGRRPIISDEWARQLHQRRVAGERSDQLAKEAGVNIVTLMSAWKRNGLSPKPEAVAAPAAPVRRIAPGVGRADEDNPRRPRGTAA